MADLFTAPSRCLTEIFSLGIERSNFEYTSKYLKSPPQLRESTGKLKISAE